MTTQNQEQQMTDYKTGEAARRRYQDILRDILKPAQTERVGENREQMMIQVADLSGTPEKPNEVDCVVGIVDMFNAQHVQTIIEKAWVCLKPGGTISLDFPDFSKTQGFPMSYALDEFVAYLSKYQEALGFALSTTGIRSLVPEARFEHIDVQAFVPRFLEPGQRKLPALVLESIKPYLVENDLGSEMELDAIVSELRHLSTQQHMMISGPMMLHLDAYKK